MFPTKRPSSLTARGVNRMRPLVLFVSVLRVSACVDLCDRSCAYVCKFMYVVYVHLCVCGLGIYAQPHCRSESKAWSYGSLASIGIQDLCNPNTTIYFETSVFVYSYLFVKRLKSCSHLCSKILLFPHF